MTLRFLSLKIFVLKQELSMQEIPYELQLSLGYISKFDENRILAGSKGLNKFPDISCRQQGQHFGRIFEIVKRRKMYNIQYEEILSMVLELPICFKNVINLHILRTGEQSFARRKQTWPFTTET